MRKVKILCDNGNLKNRNVISLIHSTRPRLTSFLPPACVPLCKQVLEDNSTCCAFLPDDIGLSQDATCSGNCMYGGDCDCLSETDINWFDLSLYDEFDLCIHCSA